MYIYLNVVHVKTILSIPGLHAKYHQPSSIISSEFITAAEVLVRHIPARRPQSHQTFLQTRDPRCSSICIQQSTEG